MILAYLSNLSADVAKEKAQAIRIVEYQHLFEVFTQHFVHIRPKFN
jgi:hypothetical protein